MEYIGIVFGIFGILAYVEVFSLKRRLEKLEEMLAKTEGTSFYDERKDLVKAARSYIGKTVNIELKEDHEDADIVMYGNSKYGTNTIVDVDEDWMLVHIKSKKGDNES